MTASVAKALLAGALVWLSLAPVEAGLKVYYLRHAEGGHNVVQEWQDKPRDQWPVYVGNQDMFTPKGEGQVEAVTGKLGQYHFDFIAASPLWRTRNTILPYLKQIKGKAEIWPELEEFNSRETKPPRPAPGRDLLGGALIAVPADEQAFFTLREDGTHHFKLGQGAAQYMSDVQALMDKIAVLIHTRFGGTDESILLVGHGNGGMLLLKTLTKKSQAGWPANTSLWMVEEQADGSFKLMMFNDKPCP